MAVPATIELMEAMRQVTLRPKRVLGRQDTSCTEEEDRENEMECVDQMTVPL